VVVNPAFDTAHLRDWQARIRAGDESAREELFRSVAARLQRLAQRMLRRFPAVRRQELTDDVLQNALVRLLRALEAVDPLSTREFLGLAALQLNRELLDLARKCARRPAAADPAPRAPGEPEVPDEGPDLERWAAFHEAVEQLPAPERDVVRLTFYHGWTQRQVAELFGVSERTVRRWWHAACGRLQAALGGDFPEW
jgi:RNA polymerase sigma-70 factor (ECF subfamily)